jgi:heterodisulfide reductase subunit A-like polyferredoxin
MSAALTLARLGVRSTIVDISPCIGGLPNELACKGDRECVKCDVCLSTDKVAMVMQNELISFVRDSKLDMLERDLGRYKATISRPSQAIDDSRCTRCGKCLDVCPADAIVRHGSREGAYYRVDRARCLHDNNGCTICADACGAFKIDLDSEEEMSEIEADGVLVAVGAMPYDPAPDRRLGYGEIEGVVTSLDVERGLNRMDGLGRKLLSGEVKRMCMVQCVGSRDPRIGSQLCSKVCCKYAMKIAKLVRARSPSTEITIFFMDWRPTERKDDLLAWASAEKGIKAVRSRPSEVAQGDDGRPVVRYALPGDLEVGEDAFDLVVLSLGLRPTKDNEDIAGMFGARLNPHGFFFGEGKQVRMFEAKGVFFAGACTGPKDIEESSMDGAVAASKIFRYLEGSE